MIREIMGVVVVRIPWTRVVTVKMLCRYPHPNTHSCLVSRRKNAPSGREIHHEINDITDLQI